MDASQQSGPARGHSRNKSGARTSRPRSATKGPLDADEGPLASPLSVQQANRFSTGGSRPSSPRVSLAHPMRSPGTGTPLRSSTPASEVPVTTKDFSFLLRPEIYHQISPLSIPVPFRHPSRQPAPETPIPDLLAAGQFRAAAIAAVQALTSSPVPAAAAAAHPPVTDPADHARIFELLYTRLACLCLADAVPLAAQEAKALEDLNSAFYLDPLTGAHLVPWHLRTLAVRLQTIGFGDPRRAVMSYYDLAREARVEIARAHAAVARGDERSREAGAAAVELWKRRLADLGIKVAGALVEMDDLAGAAEHLSSMAAVGLSGDDGQLAVAQALLWLHLGDVEAARRCVRREGDAGGSSITTTSERVVGALADMADGEYETALGKWRELREEMKASGTEDEMIGVNLAVCLLYTGKMEEGRDILEEMVGQGQTSHTLLFNLTTMYELCTDRAKVLKLGLAERVASMQPSPHGWEKTNADFKL
ncbi:hypothetical protein F4775DRAFT_558647 [Biscogniauxia sp. FL1348]|nr:hypothetical protein F4775DRAFT_558647 [Biscogniauxia sp. FL1348]